MTFSKDNTQLLCLGNAIVDVIASCDDVFLVKHGLPKASMTLIDEPRGEYLYKQMAQAIEISGGSAANTAAGFSSFGGRAAFIGKVFDDQLGKIFQHDLESVGVSFQVPPAKKGKPTARSLIFVTPDGERTMNTYLGASRHIDPDDIDENLVREAEITYVEGYLWDEPRTKESIRKAIGIAKAAGRKVAFTLSDTFCVERHRTEFLAMLEGEIDILFANKNEICSLFETRDLYDAVNAIRGKCEIAVVTRSEEGSVIINNGHEVVVHADKITRVVDATGAGDLYASGFLFGLSKKLSMLECGKLGSGAASLVIQQTGARVPKEKLQALVRM